MSDKKVPTLCDIYGVKYMDGYVLIGAQESTVTKTYISHIAVKIDILEDLCLRIITPHELPYFGQFRRGSGIHMVSPDILLHKEDTIIEGIFAVNMRTEGGTWISGDLDAGNDRFEHIFISSVFALSLLGFITEKKKEGKVNA